MNPSSNSDNPLPSDRASGLGDLVEVAEDSIVSHVLVRNGGGSMTLFAFDRGQSLSEHTAPFEAIVQVLDGALDLTIGGRPVSVRGGEVVRMPAGVPHALEAAEPCRMLLTMLRDENGR